MRIVSNFVPNNYKGIALF